MSLQVLKGSEISVWIRNIELALIGIFVGLVSTAQAVDPAYISQHHPPRARKTHPQERWISDPLISSASLTTLCWTWVVAGQVGVYYADAEMVTELGFFYGYSPIVWAAIFLQVRRAWGTTTNPPPCIHAQYSFFKLHSQHRSLRRE